MYSRCSQLKPLIFKKFFCCRYVNSSPGLLFIFCKFSPFWKLWSFHFVRKKTTFDCPANRFLHSWFSSYHQLKYKSNFDVNDTVISLKEKLNEWNTREQQTIRYVNRKYDNRTVSTSSAHVVGTENYRKYIGCGLALNR